MAKQTVRVPLRWGDMDAFGHINNAKIVQILEQARIDAFYGPGHPVEDVVVARHEIEYLSPIPYTPEPVRVEIWVARIGGSSIDIHYEIRPPEEDSDVVHVRAATVVVFLGEGMGAPRRLTPEEREEQAGYLAEPIRFHR